MLAGWKCHPSIHESFNALFFFRHWNEAVIIPFMIRGTCIIIFVSSSFSGGFLRQLFLIASSTRAREKNTGTKNTSSTREREKNTGTVDCILKQDSPIPVPDGASPLEDIFHWADIAPEPSRIA